MVVAVDGWWGGRRVAGKLSRLFFRYFAGTSFAVEKQGELVAFLVKRPTCTLWLSIRSTGRGDWDGFHMSMGFGVLEGDGAGGGVGVHRDYDGDGGDRVVFVRKLS